jgi:ABC-type multidrug transport system ATPase subunit
LDEPRFHEPDRARQRLDVEVAGGRTVFLATSDARQADGWAMQVGILVKGRLVVNEEVASLQQRFRRIRYTNQVTETRREYGNELDEFDAVSVKVRGWGVEAIVSNFEDEAFERFRGRDGIADARVEQLSLEDILAAVSSRFSAPTARDLET